MKTKAGNSEDSVYRSKLTMRFGKNAIDQALLAHLLGHGHTMSTELKRLAYMALTGGVNITPPDLISVATPVKQQGVQRTDIVERGNGGRFGSVPKQTVGAPGSESAISVAAPVTHPVMRREEQHNMEPVPQIEMVTLVKDDSQAENEPTIEYQGDQMVWTQEGSPTSSIPDNLGVKLLNF